MAIRLNIMTDRLERYFSVLALALMLLLQSMVAGGAAAGYASPWLVAPDGSLMSYADICNTSGEAAADHCAECMVLDAPVMRAPEAFEPTPLALCEVRVAAHYQVLASRPEASFQPRTGPPSA